MARGVPRLPDRSGDVPHRFLPLQFLPRQILGPDTIGESLRKIHLGKVHVRMKEHEQDMVIVSV